jgi:hypothetical protein
MKTSFHSAENTFLQIRGGTWASFAPRKRAAIVEQAFNYWRAHGFPYYQLTEKQIIQEFSRLKEKDWKAVFTDSGLRSSNAGLRLANAFQPGMWKAKVHRYRTPMEVFNDDQLLRKAIERALKIWPDRFGANASCLRRILKTFSDTASVSNYRPMIAKAVIANYSQEGPVVDFSAGYGGRLLGALALNRSYIGIEPGCDQITGLRRMMKSLRRLKFLLPEVEILNRVAEKEMPTLRARSAELVFSSPPFFNWEHYSEAHSQSFRRFPDYELWRSNFLEPVIAESHRILKRHGHLALNVSNGNRLPSAAHVREAAESIGFTLLAIHRMVFPKVPYLHPRNGEAVKTELLFVFRK